MVEKTMLIARFLRTCWTSIWLLTAMGLLTLTSCKNDPRLNDGSPGENRPPTCGGCSSPDGDEGFHSLQQLGIKTIVSVDGARPEVDLARKYGLRYVHLPIGYDAVPREQALRIARAIRDLPGPVYIHCHHGRHRGP